MIILILLKMKDCWPTLETPSLVFHRLYASESNFGVCVPLSDAGES